jgi:hypothetical protein
VRTITICTDAFEKMADLEKRALGMPDLGLAIIEHPLMYRTTDELEAIADAIAPLFEQHFTTDGPA